MPSRVKLKELATGEVIERYAIDARELLLSGEYELIREEPVSSAPTPHTTLNKSLVNEPDALGSADAVGKLKRGKKAKE